METLRALPLFWRKGVLNAGRARNRACDPVERDEPASAITCEIPGCDH